MGIFNSKQPSVRIENVEKIDVSIPHHPFYEELLFDYLKKYPSIERPPFFPFDFPISKSNQEDETHSLGKILDKVSKSLSILSGFAVIVFVILLLTDNTSIGNIKVGNLLAIFSFTLFGGLISVGGVKMFSITASLRKAQQNFKKVASISGGCPYYAVIDEETKRRHSIRSPYEIGSKEFCSGCFLVDHNGRTVCKVSPYYRN